MKIIVGLGWVAVLGGNAVSMLILFGGMSMAQGAPQEAVVICLALAASIIPYCFARALTELYRLDDKPGSSQSQPNKEPSSPYNYATIVPK